MRRGWLALCIGFGIEIVLFVVGFLTRTPPIPVHPAVHPLTFYFGIPGNILQLVVQFIVPIHGASSLVVLQTLQIAGNVLFYSAAAYFVLWLRARSKSVPMEPAATGPRRGPSRRVYVSLAIGLVMTVIAFALLRVNLNRQIINSEGGVSYTDAYPQRFYLSVPGVILMLIAINVTPVRWGSHPVAAQIVASTGNFVFYSFVAYAVLGLSSKLSARWKRT